MGRGVSGEGRGTLPKGCTRDSGRAVSNVSFCDGEVEVSFHKANAAVGDFETGGEEIWDAAEHGLPLPEIGEYEGERNAEGQREGQAFAGFANGELVKE